MTSNASTDHVTRRATRILDWFGAAVQRRVQIDLRALAVFRIAIGSIIVFDLLLRARNFTAFYTNDGVLPNEALYRSYTEVHSLHAWVGETWLVALLFVGAALLGVSMILGYRTRTVTFLSWVLLFSLHNRNPMVLNGGDTMLRLLVFWSIFLPMGERWSLDARRLERDRATVASIASLAILAQIVIMYVSNFVHKTRGQAWIDGEAVPYILTLDQFTVFLGPHLAQFPDLLVGFSYGWMVLMALAPFLLLLTGWPRAVVATGFVGMHTGMFLTLQIGVFPIVVVSALLLFYPPVVWDRVLEAAAERGITDRIRDVRSTISDAVPSKPVGPIVPLPATLPGLRPVLSTVVPAVFLVLIVVSNAHALGYAAAPPDPGQELLDKTDTEQNWRLFAPHPLSNTRWFVAEGTLASGETVDAVHGGNVTRDRPPNPADTVGTARWRKYLSNLYGNDDHQSYYANYLCDRWNRTHDGRLESVEIYAFSQEGTPWGGESDVDRTRLVAYDCSGPLVQP
ncbi:HTTM domain-containing protein [Salinarchaeum sp. Harcht-Bsk1]|uniref:HTTM domain-containing protein n=1 Tax=Salinarchaeum sp. Harcht-Bsk1 TaxID=1333523 RepID=UPI0003424279|nr:HTTM domain-containing protein [Salinarchaeum sp. Harcht-Bsk1]AGN00013.1 HTTM domain-containing protein [Salinarchaeum sp. Harcht-Bsk1]